MYSIQLCCTKIRSASGVGVVGPKLLRISKSHFQRF
jgi:hypothetical protein